MAAYSGQGCLLQVEIAAVYTTVAAVRDIAGPSMATNPIDVSSRASIARTFLPGMRDNGEITFDIIYDPDLASQSASVAGGLVKLQLDGTASNWKLLFPTATTIAQVGFSAFVTNFSAKEPMDDAMTADLTLKIAGEVAWA